MPKTKQTSKTRTHTDTKHVGGCHRTCKHTFECPCDNPHAILTEPSRVSVLDGIGMSKCRKRNKHRKHAQIRTQSTWVGVIGHVNIHLSVLVTIPMLSVAKPSRVSELDGIGMSKCRKRNKHRIHAQIRTQSTWTRFQTPQRRPWQS